MRVAINKSSYITKAPKSVNFSYSSLFAKNVPLTLILLFPLYLLLSNATKVVFPAPDGPRIAVSYPLNAYPVTLFNIYFVFDSFSKRFSDSLTLVFFLIS